MTHPLDTYRAAAATLAQTALDAARGPSAVRKDTTTFAAQQAGKELADWLPAALQSLADVVLAAIAPPAGDAPADVTPALRVQAVSNSVADFGTELVDRVTAVIDEQPATVQKRSPWARVFGVK